MKIISILFAIQMLLGTPILAQSLGNEDKELYPEQYTFEEAASYQKNGEIEKALWFYINLFPVNKTQTIEAVKALAAQLDTVDMSLLIKVSFAKYGTFDPTISSFENGTMNLDMKKLSTKGAWGDELIQKISDPEGSLTSASEYNFRGLDKAKAGDFLNAIEDFDKAIDIEPTGQIYFNRAYAKSMIEDFRGAIEDYDKAIDLQYRLAEAYFERGYCKDKIKNLVGALDDYTKAIETNKEYAAAYNNRAFTKLKQKDYKEAIKDFDKAIKIQPDFAGAYVNRGYAKKEMGDSKGACKDWIKAGELGFTEANQFIRNNCQ